MDVGQLKTMVHVAEHGSFSAATKRLRTAQPALSRHIDGGMPQSSGVLLGGE